MSDTHDGQTARQPSLAAKERQVQRELTERMKADIADWVSQHDIRFTYLRNPSGDCRGGATLAWTHYKEAHDNFKLIKVSIAWCSPREPFNKTLGRWVAAKAFLEGHWTNIRIEDPRSHISSQLQDIFQNQI